MKIKFEDKSYIDFQKSAEPGKVIITIMAKDQFNNMKNIANSVEITQEELLQLVNAVK
jgi:hypothetical protein